MSRKVLVDLAMKLSANSAELKRGLDESRREMRRLNDTASNMGRQMTFAFAKITAAVVAVRGAFNALESTFRSTRAGADALDSEITGLKNGISFLQVAVASFDFSNLINGFYNAVAVGREFQDMMDRISDSQRALSWRGSEDDVRLAELRRVIYQEEVTSSARIEAIKESQNIIQARLNDRLRVAEMAYDAIYDKIKNTYQLSEEQMNSVIHYLREFDRLDDIQPLAELLEADEALRKLRDIDESRRKVLGTDRAGQPIMGPLNLSPATIQQQETVNQMILNLDRETLLLWESIKRNMGTISDAVRDALTQAGVEVNKIKSDSINQMAALDRYLRSALRGQGGAAAQQGVDVWSGIDMGQMGVSFAQRLAPLIQQEQEVMEGYIDTIINYGNALELAARSNQVYGDSFDYTGAQIRIVQAAIDALLIQGYQLSDGVFDSLIHKLDELNDGLDVSAQKFNIWGNVGSSAAHMIAASFVDMAMGIEQNIEDIIKQLLRMIATQLLSNAIMGIFGGGAGMMAGGMIMNPGAMGTPFNMNIPQMASGGIAYGPSIVQVGEYPGARLDPEIISRASDLRNILGFDRGGMNVNVYGHLDGEDLYLSNNRFSTRKNLVE